MTPLARLLAALRRIFGARGFDMAGVEEALARLETDSYDSAAAQMKVAESAAAITQGMENVPAWWRAEAARFDAAAGISTAWAEDVWREQDGVPPLPN